METGDKMYNYIKGIITEVTSSYVVIENQNIGYQINVGNPYIYKTEDLPELISSECLFARKFDENVDKKVILELERRLKKNNEIWK